MGSKDQQNQCNLASELATSKLPDGGHAHVTQSPGHLSPYGSVAEDSSEDAQCSLIHGQRPPKPLNLV